MLWCLVAVLRAWNRTLRPQIDRDRIEREGRDVQPTIYVFWHNRLFFTSRLLRLLHPDRPVVALVSASRDGAVFAKFLSFLGLRAVRGSSSRFGREAAHSLIQALRDGHNVAVTPDGPRGPMYDMKPGALLAARRTGASILLIGVECRSCWSLRSWDRFRIPWPGARMNVRLERIDAAHLGHGNEALARLRTRLLALNGDSDPDAT